MRTASEYHNCTSSSQASTSKPITSAQLWVEKYRPKKLESIIGQQNKAKRLKRWLEDWNKNRKGKPKWNDREFGSSFKAALLSGPPGIGKTTTATVVCKVP